MNKKGIVLIHVLVLAMIVATITAGLTRMILMNYTATRRAIKGGQNKQESDALVNRAMAYWNATNTVCSTVPGMPCLPASVVPPGVCNCICADAASDAEIRVTDPDGTPGPPCDITSVSSDVP